MSALASEPFFWLFVAAIGLTLVSLTWTLICMARAHVAEATRRLRREERLKALDEDARREELLRAQRAAKRPIGYKPPHVDHEHSHRD